MRTLQLCHYQEEKIIKVAGYAGEDPEKNITTNVEMQLAGNVRERKP